MRIVHSIMGLAVASVFLLAGSLAFAESPVDKRQLGYRLSVGDQYRGTLHLTNKVTQTVNGNAMIRTLSADLQLRCHIRQVAEAGVAECAIRCEAVTLHEQTPFESNQIAIVLPEQPAQESTNETPNATGRLTPQGQNLAKIVGHQVTFQLTPDGVARFGKAVKEQQFTMEAPESGKSDTMEFLARMFGSLNNPWESRFGEVVLGLVGTLPQTPVGLNDTWQHQQVLPFAPVKLDSLIQYQVVTFQDGYVTVKATAEIEQEFQKKLSVTVQSKQQFQSQLAGTLTGMLRGEYRFDQATGWLHQATLATRLTGEVQSAKAAVPVIVELALEWRTRRIER